VSDGTEARFDAETGRLRLSFLLRGDRLIKVGTR
jgi:hypothetical protein